MQSPVDLVERLLLMESMGNHGAQSPECQPFHEVRGRSAGDCMAPEKLVREEFLNGLVEVLHQVVDRFVDQSCQVYRNGA